MGLLLASIAQGGTEHRSLRAVTDDQKTIPAVIPKASARGAGVVGQGENSQEQARLRSYDGPRQYAPTHVRWPCHRQPTVPWVRADAACL